jgi:hypothetical protein
MPVANAYALSVFLSNNLIGNHLFVYSNPGRCLSVVRFRQVWLLADQANGTTQCEGGFFAQELVVCGEVFQSRRPIAFDLIFRDGWVVAEKRAAHFLGSGNLGIEEPLIVSVLRCGIAEVAVNDALVW